MIKEPLSVLPLDPVTRLTGHSVSSLRLRSKGDMALIGAYGAPGGGKAYVFKRSGVNWIEQAMLTASDAAQHARSIRRSARRACVVEQTARAGKQVLRTRECGPRRQER